MYPRDEIAISSYVAVSLTRLGLLNLLLLAPPLAGAAGNGYLGRNTCAGCHKAIALAQARTNMARA